jgi:hypothetical protein
MFRFSETSVDFQRTTWRCIPEDSRTLHNQRCENLKSYILCVVSEDTLCGPVHVRLPCNSVVQKFGNGCRRHGNVIAWRSNEGLVTTVPGTRKSSVLGVRVYCKRLSRDYVASVHPLSEEPDLVCICLNFLKNTNQSCCPLDRNMCELGVT